MLLMNAFCISFAKGILKMMVASTSPFAVFDDARLLRVVSLLRRTMSVLRAGCFYRPPPPPPPDFGHWASGRWQVTAQEVRPPRSSNRLRLTAGLFAVALALLASTAEARWHKLGDTIYSKISFPDIAYVVVEKGATKFWPSLELTLDSGTVHMILLDTSGQPFTPPRIRPQIQEAINWFQCGLVLLATYGQARELCFQHQQVKQYLTLDDMWFAYTIQPGDYDTNGASIHADALKWNGSVIMDPSLERMDTRQPEIINDPEIKVDGIPPWVTKVRVGVPRVSGHYSVGERIRVRVGFSESVTMADGTTPVLQMSLGDDDPRLVAMEYEEMQAGDDSMLFGYTVQIGDEDNNGIGIAANALEVTGGKITDIAGNPLETLDLSAFAFDNDPNHKVDGSRPRVARVDIESEPENGHTYREGEVIEISLSFNEEIVWTNNLSLTLNLGSAVVSMRPSHRVGLHEFLAYAYFSYTVQHGDLDEDGISIGADALIVRYGGGIPFDKLRNPVELSLAEHAFTDNPGHKVGGRAAPRVTGLYISTNNVWSPGRGDTHRKGKTMRFTLTFSGSLVGDLDNLRLTLNLDSGAVVSHSLYAEGHNKFVTFYYDVQNGDLDEDGISIGADALSLTGGSVTGQSGIPLIMSLAEHTVTNDPDHKVDGVAPEVTNVTITSTPQQFGYYHAGERITARVDFNESVTVGAGIPVLSMSLGDAAPRLIAMEYRAVRAQDDFLLFGYTVQPGDVDHNGIGANALEVTGGSVTDQAGNPADLSLTEYAFAFSEHKVDAVAPEVTAVTITSTPQQFGYYAVGERITARVEFSESVTVGDGTPTLSMFLGNANPRLVPMEHEATQPADDALLFGYTVQPGDADDNGISIGANALEVTGGSVTDQAGNPAADLDLTPFGFQNNPDHKVDAAVPGVTGLAIISTPSRDTAPYETKTQDTYLLGERIRMRLDFSEPVLVAADVSPKPILHLNLEIGSTDIPIQFHFPADSNAPVMALEGSYLVQEGDLDEDGISSSNLFLAGVPAEITDAAGNELDLHIPGLPTNPAHKVDGVVPKVSLVLVRRSPANDTYRLGEEIKVLIAFDSLFPLFLGQLSLQLTLDSGVVTARNSGTHQGIGSHGRGFDFSYVVQAGDVDENGISLGADALRLVAGEIITDDSGNPVNLSLAEFAFNDDPRYKVDTAPPRVTAMSVISTPRLAGHYSAGERITARVDFNEPVTVADGTTPILQMSLGDDAPLVAMEYEDVQAGDASLLFGYTVQAGDEDNDGIGIGADALSVTDGNLTDTIGNPAANLDLTAFAFENDPEHKVDGVGPQVTNVSITSRPQQFGYYATGERITARVDFSESVTVAGGTTPVLQMSLGDAAPRLVAMEYETAQAGADSMLFGYTVQTGDEDNNGIGIGADALAVTGGDPTTVTDTLGNPAADLGLTAFAIENDPQHKVDGVPPDITAPADITFEATDTLTPLGRTHYGTATSGDDTADITDDAPDAFPLGATTITWTATDPAGNEMMDTQVVTVVDTTKPSIALLGDNPQTVEFGSIYNDPGATATDAVDDNDELTTQIAAASTVDTGTVGDYTVTYTVSDKATNAATPVIRMVTVTDTEAPDISPPADITFEATDTLTPLSRSDYGTATSGDDTADITDDAPDAFPLGATTITWTATDPATNEMIATQVVTIVDTTPPDIVLLGDNPQTVEFGTAYTELGATATDAVDDDDELTRRIVIDANAVDVDLIGTYAVTYDVTDAEGNAADRVTRMVMVTDTVIPDIIAPAAYTTEATATLTPLDRSDYGTATSGDDTADITDDAPDAFPLGATTITWAATDPATNEMIATQVVTIVDTTKPVIALLGADPQTVEFGTTYTELNATATDEVDDDDELTRRIVIDANAVDVDLIGTYAVTYDVTDAEGNAADRVTRMVMVTDTVIPDITAPLAITFEATDTLTPLSRSDYGTATSGDDTADITDDAPDAFPLGATTITWTATDPATNEMIATQVVTIVDTTKPVIALLGDNPQTVEFGSIYNDPGATATDAVDDDDELTIRIAAVSTVDTGTVGDYTVTYTVSDKATNAATPVIRMVTVTDTEAPTIIAPADITFEATDTLTPLGRTHYGTATSTDREAMITDDAPLAFSVGVHTITWTATDTNTLFSTAAQTITITDTTAPDIAAPGNITEEATGPTTPVTVGLAIATDLVTDPVIITRTPEGNEFAVGTHTITWKADDGNGNIITAEQTITITDTTKPVIALLGADPQTVEFGSVYTDPGATATDQVDNDTELTEKIAAVSTVDTGTVGDYTVTYTVSDKATNVATPVTRMVTVTDTAAPDISPPADITFEATDTLTLLDRSDYGIATSGDDNADITDDAPDAFPLGPTTITWTATDKSTNEMMDTQVVTVVDTTKPDITAPGNIIKEATGPTTPVTVGLATAMDLVTASVIITRTPEGNEFAVGTHTITWKADDDNGNIITAEQMVTITDTTAPVIALLGDNPQTVEFGSVYTDPGATATDAVDDNDELTTQIAAISTVDTGTVGDYTITYTVSDTATNAATPVIRMVTVTDTAAPTITAPADITLEATDTLTPLGRTHYGTATSGDDTADITDDAPDAFPLGATTITWTATDKSNNEDRATQVVTVVDTTKPVIALLGDNPQTVEFGTTYTELNATATDEVDDDIKLTARIVADASTVDVDLLGTYPVTYDVTDAEGNAADRVTRMVMVTDTVIPDITAPLAMTFEATDTLTPLSRSDYGTATSGDDTADITDDAPDAFPLGDTTITWTATDPATNEMMATQVVTIVDTTPPVIALLGDNPQTVEFGSTYTDPGATATDAVDDNDELTIQIAAASTVDTGTVGDYTVTYTVSDTATNAATPVIRMVTVTDTAAPDIIAPADMTFEATDTLTPLDRTHYGTATSTDREAMITDDAPLAFSVGVHTITWTATDTNTLFSTAAQTITITDTTAPDITAPENIIKEATGPTTPVTVGQATATDLVTDPVIITRSPEGNEFAVGTHTITWKADDGNGNIITAEQTITITDTTPPVIVLLGDNPQTVEFGSIYNDPGATATDAVDDNDELTIRIAAVSTVNTGTVGDYTVTYTVSDKATNAATPVTRMVTVTDTAAPTITAPADITLEATDTLTPLSRTHYGIATSSDDTADITDDAPDAFPLGATTITWTATDPATNEMIATQVVTIVDTTKPVIALLGADPQTVEFGTTYTELNATATDEVDDDDELTRRIVIDANAVDVDLIGTYPVTYDVTDAEGNAADRVTRMVMVTDTAAPDISPPADITFEATDTLTPLGRTHYGTATSTDHESMITDDAPLAFPLGETMITWTATDKSTNEMMDTQVVTIVDTTKPDITAPENIIKEATGPTTPVTVGLATAMDLVTDPVIITRTPEGNEFAVGTHTITWKADDGNGNIITAEQTITITDTTKPSIALLGTNPQTVEFGSIYNDPGATATDAVDDDITLTAKIVIDVSGVDTNQVGTHQVTYDVTDAEGNAADRVTRMVMVTDTVIPDITAPLAITFEATDTLTPLSRSDYGTATSGDDTADITDDAPDAFPLGATTITWTATDPATNEMMATQVVTIVDTTPPDIALLGDNPQTVEFGSVYTDPGATATDAVDDNDELTTQIAAASTVDTGTVGDYTVTYTVSDKATNVATPVIRMVTVTDTTAPDISPPANITFEATDTLTPLGRSDYGIATSTDGNADISDDAPEMFSVGVHTITWTATDTNALKSTAEQTITITDTTKPDITAPRNITKEATGPTTPVTVGLATATDLVTASVTITRSPTDDAFAVGTHTITWKADDDNGNIITAEQTITITDTTKPVIALLGADPQTVEFGSIYNDPGATATDAVDDNDELTTQIAADSTVDTGTVGDYTVTYTVSDKATNAATPVIRMVTVTDTAAPDIIAPANITFEATDTLTPLGRTHYGTATSTDREAMITDDAPLAFSVGVHTITWTATDTNTLFSTAAQTITITDTTAPDITAPGNITKEATGPTTPVTVGLATATDLVTDPVIITRSPEGNEFAVGTHTITWKADDGNGNIITAAQTVTITDTTKPVIVLLGDNPQTVEFGSIYNDPGATATDAVDDNDELTIRIAAASTVNTGTVGDYTVTYTVSDKATNAATPVLRTVTVTDTAAPDITAPLAITFEATDTLTPLSRSDYGTATSGDDTADITDDAPDAFPLGATTITWTATDPATNEMMATQVVTIVDTTPPDIALLGDNPQTVEFGSIYNDPGATATDAVDDDDELTIRIAAVSTVDTGTVGDYTVTYTVSDTATNAATPVIRMVTVTDTAAPDITAPAAYTTEATATLTLLDRADYGIATSTDDTADITDDAPEMFSVGVHTITWTATDTNTLFSTAAQTITITDTTKPVIVLLGDNPQTVEFGSIYNDPGATATDAVDDDDELTIRIAAASTVDTGTVGDYTVTYTVSDKATNAATPVIRMVTVTVTAPTTESTDADLSSLTIADNTDTAVSLNQTFDAAVLMGYTASVANGVSSVTLTPTVNDAASVTVDGTPVTSTEASQPINLTAGVATPINIVVTAEDGNTKTYTVTVTRAPDNQPPFAGTGADRDVPPGTLVTLDGSTSSDPDNDALDYTWTHTSTDRVVTTPSTAITLMTGDDPAMATFTAPASAAILVFTLEVTDGTDTSTGMVTITVTAPTVANTAPSIVGAQLVGRDENGNTVVATYTVPDTENNNITWTLTGADASFFTISTSGALTFRASPDYETKSTYSVIVHATETNGSPSNLDDELEVTVTLENVDETGDIGIIDGVAQVGQVLTAGDVTDPDGGVMVTTYAWQDAADDSSIATGPENTYTLMATDEGKTIQVVATYTDSFGAQTVTSIPTAMVVAADAPDPVSDIDLAVDTGSSPTDGITQNGRVNVTLASDFDSARGDTWKYSIKGSGFSTGTDTFFTLDEGVYAATDVQVVQTLLGTDSPARSLRAVTVDKTAPTVTRVGAASVILLVGASYTDEGVNPPATGDTQTTVITDSDDRAVAAVDTRTAGTYTYTYTATDVAGNAATVTRMVTVTDTPLDITAPPDMTFEATAVMTPLSRSDYGTATSGDDTADITDDAPDAFPLGETMIEWTATDTNNLRSSAQQMITVEDTIKPIITLLGDNPMTIEVGEDYMEPGATAFDRMDSDLTDQIAIDATEVDTNTVGTYTVTYSVADLQDNQAQASRSVQVLASPDLADLNRVILSEVARAIADQNISTIASRVERLRTQPNGAGFNFAGQQMSFGGNDNESMSSTVANLMRSHGQALADDTLDMKTLLGNSDFSIVIPAQSGIQSGYEPGLVGNETGISLIPQTNYAAAPIPGTLTLWGSGDYRNLSGEDNDQTLDWDGDLFSLHLGVDTRITAGVIGGVALSWSEGEMDTNKDKIKATYDISMTSINPYFGWSDEYGEVWMTAGYSKGELEREDGTGTTSTNDLSMQTFAIGGNSILLRRGADTLRLKGEISQSVLAVDANKDDSGLSEMEVDANRARLSLESTNTVTWGNGARTDRKVELGARHDGGDGVTGTGIELGLGLRHVSAAGLSVEGKLRGLLGHTGDVNEWGISGTIKQSAGADGQGFSFALSPGYGDDSSDLQRLWEHGLRDADGNASSGTTDADGNADPDYTARTRAYSARLDARIGYGVNGFTAPSWLGSGSGIGLLTPYTAMTLSNDSNRYRLGLQWKLGDHLDFDLLGERQDADDSADTILLKGVLRF